MAQDKPEEAMKWYKSHCIRRKCKSLQQYGVASMNMGWYEDASYYFQKLIKRTSKHPNLLNLADVYILKENFKEAGKYLTQAAKLDDSK